MDVVPILLFQLAFAWLYCREIVRIRFACTTIFVIVYLAIALMVRWRFGHVLNGSMIYAPAMMLILVLGIYQLKTRGTESYALLAATGVFALAATFRSIDRMVCPGFPLGTHFLWHVLNPIALYLLMRGFLANRTGMRQ